MTSTACGIIPTRDQFRITVIDRAGNVLYENGADTSATENHADRAEVVAALAGKPHTVQRYSATLGRTMTYYALATTLDSGETIAHPAGGPEQSRSAPSCWRLCHSCCWRWYWRWCCPRCWLGAFRRTCSDRIGDVARSLRLAQRWEV